MESLRRRVRYGESPPIGFWHTNQSDEIGRRIDYAPRGDSDYFSTILPAARVSASDAADGACDHKKLELLGSLGTIPSAPVDHRILLGTNIRDLQYLKNVAIFIDKLREYGGSYWIKDFDSLGNSKIYTLDPLMDSETPRKGNDQFHCDTVEWPNPWHVFMTGNQDSHTFAPEIKAPWRRLVVLEGLSMMARDRALRRPSGLKYRRENPDYDEGEKQAQLPLLFDTSIDWLIEQHLGKFGIADYTMTSGYAFQVSWFEVANEADIHERYLKQLRESASENLRSGPLYGTDNSNFPKLLCHEAYTLYAVPEDNREPQATKRHPSLDEMAISKDYWTILVMASLPHTVVFREQRSYDDERDELQMTMVRLIIIGLLRAWHGFRSFQLHVDTLLTNGSEIFDPTNHDRLLFDDDNHSRSRRYSWLINALFEADRILEQNITAWNEYFHRFIEPYLENSEIWPAERRKALDKRIERCNEMRDKLQKVRDDFKEQKARTLAFREAMFSASSMLETRASTRLGENVQLLTFVSIFYMPLAFCTSLWSTTDTFNFNALACTMVLVALSTYILVFNLRHVVDAVQGRYLSWKSEAIREMKSDGHSAWVDKGEKFERFQTRVGGREQRPSEWSVVAFYMLKLVEKAGLRKVNNSKKSSSA